MLDRLSDFWAELRRRQVVRAGVIYAAAMWVVIQAATSVFPVLQLPEWLTRVVVMTALIGFPLVLILAWLFEVRPESSSKAEPAERRRGRRVAGVVLALLIAGAAVGIWSRRVMSSSSLSPHTIAILPFSVRGSSEYSYLEQGMVDLLSTKLDDAGALRTADARAVIGVVKQQGAVEDSRDGLRIARRLAAGLFVLGNVVEAADRLHIKATIYNAAFGTRAIGSASREGPADSVFTIVDELAVELLSHVAEGSDKHLTRVAALTTPSLPALKSYLEGEEQFRGGHYTSAVQAFQRAIAQDTGFALAYYRLSVVAEWSGSPLATEAARDALLRSGRLTEDDRQLVHALLAWRSGDGEKAERMYRAILGSDVDNVEAWMQLAEVLTHYGPMRGKSFTIAREPFERVLQYEPTHVGALWHLVRIAVHENKKSEADSLIARIEQLAPEGDRLLELHALRAFHFGDRAEQQRVMQGLNTAVDYTRYMTAWNVAGYGARYAAAYEIAKFLAEDSRSTNARVTGHILRAHMAIAQGKYADADVEIERAVELDRGAGTLFGAYFAILPVVPTDRARIARAVDALDRLELSGDVAPEPIMYLRPATELQREVRVYLLGIGHARLGQVNRATGYAKELDTFVGDSVDRKIVQDWALVIRAHVALALGDSVGALAQLEQANMHVWHTRASQSPFFSTGAVRFLRAELLAAQGRKDEALGWYRSFLHTSPYDVIFETAADRKRRNLRGSDT